MTTGSLHKKYNKWYIVICFNNDGKQTQKWINTGLPIPGNKKKAEVILNEKITEYESRKSIQKHKNENNELFCDFLSDWLEIHKMNIESITYAGYKRILKQVYPYFKKLDVSLSVLSPIHIQKYYSVKLKTIGPNTVLKHHAFIRSALAYARKMNLVKENVADLVEKPKKQKFIGSFYNQEDISRLLKLIKDSPIETPVMLAAYFGLRRSEILGIKWDSIDLVNRTLTVNHKIVPVNDTGKYRLEISDTLKTSSSYRTLPLNTSLYKYLSELKKKQDENKKFCGKSYNHAYENYVCVNELGNIMLPNYITKNFKRLLERNDMRVIRFHDLRHSCASLLLRLGYNMKQIQEWLGHGSINTTMNIYAHIEAESKKDMIDGIEKAINDSVDNELPAETASCIPKNQQRLVQRGEKSKSAELNSVQ
ncbi:MAG: tyrosine-type recombinase/integrase [Oscillospiraceae bacterium]|nr:tyrosine-type recombinase/integrase [Oscillospiraceae bacterium]